VGYQDLGVENRAGDAGAGEFFNGFPAAVAYIQVRIRVVLLIYGVEEIFDFMLFQFIHHLVYLSLKKALQIIERKTDAMICYARLRIVVGSYALAAVARAYL
jgi:hypothetical protein